MSKPQPLQYADEEKMAKIDPAEELYVDLLRSTEACDEEMKKRIEWLQGSLFDVLGRISQHYPRIDQWSEERVEELHNWVSWSWHFRNELRLLWAMQNPDHDVTEAAEGWKFACEDKFGPLPDAVIH